MSVLDMADLPPFDRWEADGKVPSCTNADPDTFFPEKGGSTAPAKAICGPCPARDVCLEWALTTGQKFGVWGGLSERERVRAARDRGIPRHGTLTGYTGDGCRCVRCRDAVTEYTQDRRARTAAA